jgi:hypothetical protein
MLSLAAALARMLLSFRIVWRLVWWSGIYDPGEPEIPWDDCPFLHTEPPKDPILSGKVGRRGQPTAGLFPTSTLPRRRSSWLWRSRGLGGLRYERGAGCRSHNQILSCW